MTERWSKYTRLHRFALGLLVATLAVPGAAEGAVLCLGENGHIAVESACVPADCCDADHEAYSSGGAQLHADDYQHSCTDIPLFRAGDPSLAPQRAVSVAPYSDATVCHARLLTTRVAFAPGKHPDLPVRPIGSVTPEVCLRTIILLV